MFFGASIGFSIKHFRPPLPETTVKTEVDHLESHIINGFENKELDHAIDALCASAIP